MSRSLTVVMMVSVLAAGSAIWIGKSLAQSASITSSGGSSAATAGPGAVERGSGSTLWFREGGGEVSAEVERLRQTDRKHALSTRTLVAKHQQSSDSQERDSLRAELSKVIAEQFETRQQIKARELAELEAQLRHLRTLHERRQKEKDQIVGDRVQKMLRDADGLGWGSDDGDGGNFDSPLGKRRSVSSSNSFGPASAGSRQ